MLDQISSCDAASDEDFTEKRRWNTGGGGVSIWSRSQSADNNKGS